MLRHTVRTAVLRASNIRAVRNLRPCGRAVPAIPTSAPAWRTQSHAYSVSANETKEEAAKRLGKFMATAKFAEIMKAEFGDHESWDHEKLQKLVYGDQLISGVDLWRFHTLAQDGLLPGGGRTSFPLLMREEVGLLETPYHQWAPAPYSNLSHSCLERAAILLGNEGADVNGSKLSPVADFWGRLRPLRAKLRAGLVPMSRDRWLQKKMDEPQNYRSLMELMQDIVTIFEWLQQERIQSRMRDCFNFMADQFAEFDAAANLLRERNGVQEKLNLAAMWVEYYHGTLSDMTDRTYQWLETRVGEVQARAFEEYNASLEETRGDQEAIGEAGKKYYECVQDLHGMMARVDCTLGISMAGFKGYQASNSASDLTLRDRGTAYFKMADIMEKSWKYLPKILEGQHQEEASGDFKPPQNAFNQLEMMKKPAHPRFRDSETFIGHYHEAKKLRTELSRALRGEPKALGDEYWVAALRERMGFQLQNSSDPRTHRWGFVCYRLTYDQSDAEWADFKKKFEADVFRSGDWIKGYDTIANMAGIEYVDGRDVGIGEGDIEAARQHFGTPNEQPHLGRMWTMDFLVVDRQSFASYAKPVVPEKRPPPPYGPCFGDNGGFVRLVDVFPLDQKFNDAISPGYRGDMKVLSSLLLEEVYPLLATMSVRPHGLWPLARLHTKEVYVGHTVPAQEYWWEFQNIDTNFMLRMARESIEKAS